MTIRTLLVANRGEIARRIFATCRAAGIRTVAVYSDADAGAPHVLDADQAVRLPGNTPAETYLRGDLIIEAAKATHADAIHPGYGFLSENPEFAYSVVDEGITWVGPSADVIAQMGDKVYAKEIAVSQGVPVLGPLEVAEVTSEHLPVLVKAAAGGGGRGMRIVDDLADLADASATAAAEAQSAFGDPTVFIEPYLVNARHVEVQVLADTHGTVWILGDRDCSIQRNHQKIVEEAPAPGLPEPVREGLHEAARALASGIGYVGAGTVEFLVAGDSFYLLEMNTRLQVEHPVTEAIFGVDLVALQLTVAEGRELGPAPAQRDAHAVEVRVYAEDPAAGWTPQTGTVRSFDIEGAPFRFDEEGVRLDAGFSGGDTISVHYDAMLAKVIATSRDRESALRKLDGVLRRAAVTGVTTNIGLLRAIVSDADVRSGRISTSLLGDKLPEWIAGGDDNGRELAAIAASIAAAHRDAAASPVLNRIPVAFRNVPSQPRRRTWNIGGEQVTVAYRNTRGGFVIEEPTGYTIGRSSQDAVEVIRGVVMDRLTVSHHATGADVTGTDGTVSAETVAIFTDPADEVASGSLLAPMPAVVVSVAVAEGQEVAQGDTIVVLEAMKMQHTIAAPVAGTVRELSVETGKTIEAGAVLAIIEGDEL